MDKTYEISRDVRLTVIFNNEQLLLILRHIFIQGCLALIIKQVIMNNQ